jgi:hypothetical protein
MARTSRCLVGFLALSSVTAFAQDDGSRVVVLGGTVSIQIPRGWAYVEKGRDTRVGPKGSPFVRMGYFQAELQDLSHPVAREDASEFVANNLKIPKTENLSGGRVFGHAVERGGAVEHHDWNIAIAVDATHIAVLLLGMETGADHAKIVSLVDQMARSVQFIPHKRKA